MSPLSEPLALKLQVFLVLLFLGATSAQLSPRFYDASCPNALSIIRYGVQRAVYNEARMGASLLRLHFHDCFVNGCDGSILLADNATFKGEQHSISNNNSIRGFNVIDNIKSQVESVCPGIVSCADIVAVAARDSVVVLGGPSWNVQLGRRDSIPAKASLIKDANDNIPSPLLDLSGLHDHFSRKGFTDEELVALSGAHTLGQARCVGFRKRIYSDTTIDPSFKASLQSICPMGEGNGDSNLAPLDSTPNRFDNAFFNDLTNYRGLLHSDQVLYGYHRAGAQVAKYGWYSSAFFNDFANAMVKMGNLDPLTGSRGQIRKICSRTN